MRNGGRWAVGKEHFLSQGGQDAVKGDAVKRSPASSPRLGMLGEAQKEE